MYAREALVTFLCLLANVCHLVFLQLMWSNFKASRQCVSSCEFAMHRESVGSVIVLLTAVWFFSDMLPHLVLS